MKFRIPPEVRDALALDRIAIPLIPVMGVDEAYREAARQLENTGELRGAESS